MTTSGTEGKRKRVIKAPEARRSDILRASQDVFGTIGFAKAKISDITEAADIGKGTFYAHFETKDHVLGALWEEYVNAFVTSTEEILARDLAWWPTIDELLTTLVDHALRHAELHRMVYGSANAKSLELCKASNGRVISLMSDFVVRGTAAGAFSCRNPDWTFRMIYHAADGLLDDLIARRIPIDVEEVKLSVLNLTHRGLGDPDLAD